MPVYVEWHNAEHTILLYRLIDGWTWEHYHAANAYVRDLLSSVDHPVDMICDFSESVVLPPRMIANFGRTLREPVHPNRGRVVLVGVTGLMQILWGVIRNLHPQATANMLEAVTIDHALRLLREPASTQS